MHGVETVGKAMILLMGTFVAIATFVIIPLITAYLLLDLENLKNGLSAVVPPKRWRATLDFLHDVDHVIGGFIRGQLLVALAVGVLITIALLILRVPYAFLLGLLAAIGDLIPYVGAILAFVPAISTALFVNGWVNALIVLVVFVGIFEIEGHVIAPNIVGNQVSLSPFIVLLALLIGGDLGGLVGMLVAVPIAGVLRVIAMRVFSAPPTNGAVRERNTQPRKARRYRRGTDGPGRQPPRGRYGPFRDSICATARKLRGRSDRNDRGPRKPAGADSRIGATPRLRREVLRRHHRGLRAISPSSIEGACAKAASRSFWAEIIRSRWERSTV